MTEKANIINYKSNKRTFGDEEWRYCSKPDDLGKYKLDYRVVLERVGGLHVDSYWSSSRAVNGLSNNAANFLEDLRTIASNIGFDTSNFGGVSDFHWDTHVKNCFQFHNMRTGTAETLFEAKAYKNGNLHLRFNQRFIRKLSLEHGRLVGWIKSPKEASEELDISIEEATDSFNSNLQLGSSSLLSIGFSKAA